MNDSLKNLSPLDGRYQNKTKQTREIFSEHALIKERVRVEIQWLNYFLTYFKPELLSEKVKKKINALDKDISDTLIERVKEIEHTTNHDVKAVELAVAEQFEQSEEIQSLVHIFLTSEDVNSLSYALMLKNANLVLIEWIEQIISALEDLAEKNKEVAMLARTHGQPASPTTLGKELNVFATRLTKEKRSLSEKKFYAKWGGATANYNPHLLAYPEEDWVNHSKDFLSNLGVELTKVATQIEPHDYMADLFQNIQRINNILLDLTQDIWSYIAFDYFSLKMKKNEVGSSTMPHKINPIDFENAEGNLGLSNAILNHLTHKLTVSRLQRDLSDSTVLRNIGTGYGYLEIAVSSTLLGLSKLEANTSKISTDLDDRYELLAEALQSFLRLEGKKDGYNQVKKLSRGMKMDKDMYLKAVEDLIENEDYKEILKGLTPKEYLGIASQLAEKDDEI
ncbi:MAG: adenylosuccinate lyase [Gammaproteobacteria bacterium]|nr:adenylosuccinate lyase [Gammaproteobacteria bacterium]|tara:strand:- start:5750 stop:7102 length:1353 start_codon:yes stop_codon:yes gene_type:complete